MFTEQGTLPDGILENSIICQDYTLAEETFRHTLEVGNDPAIDSKRLNDSTYFSAAILAKRLTVAGVAAITPDTVLDLSGADGRELMYRAAVLDQRREEFRSKSQKLADGCAVDGEAGAAAGAGGTDAAGGDPGATEGQRSVVKAGGEAGQA
jgi:hypothetical protein